MGLLREILVGGWSLIAGMGVTVKRLFRPVITLQYPRYKVTMFDNFRGHIELKRGPNGDGQLCVACGTCVRECPSKLILVQGMKDHVKDHKRPTHYVIDFTRCSLCGLCVDACPTGALTFSKEFELASLSRWDGVIDLVARFEERA
ncbi:MAG: NADH-quinone oxidoreductase subunit I [Proteobacteria bacterium]|nr:NADH-quinone oxidoreductase subunit I [Pseudomonadota bacterium]